MAKRTTIPLDKCSVIAIVGASCSRVTLKSDIFTIGEDVEVIEFWDRVVIKRASVFTNKTRRVYKNSSSAAGMAVTLYSKYENGIYDIEYIDGDSIEICVKQM